jgi:hypothetical protein
MFAVKTWLPLEGVYKAMRELKSDCDHPEERIFWKLQTYEYVCKDCETLFSHEDIRGIMNDAPKN